jgi:hypothetical protein
MPNGHKIYQHIPSQDPPKFIQMSIFGLKINHPATLDEMSGKKNKRRNCFPIGRKMNGLGSGRPDWAIFFLFGRCLQMWGNFM